MLFCLFFVFLKLVVFNFILSLVDGYNFIFFIIGCLGSAIVVASFFSIANPKKRAKLLMLADFILSLILLTDIVYNRYFYDVTSVALIKQAKLATEVKSSVFQLISGADLFIFLDILLFLVLYIKFKERMMEFNNKPYLKLKTFVFLMCIGLVFSFTSVKALEKEQPGITKTLYDKKYIVKRIGNFNFHVFDFYRYITSTVVKKDDITQDEIKQVETWLNEKNNIKNRKYFSSMKGKNLIIVQLEAFQGFVLNRTINGVEITPNLNKLAKESLLFENCYYQTAYGGTSDAEFIVNNSLLPIKEGSVYYQYAGNYYESISKMLKEKGYYTSVMHANRPAFWNRVSMYKSLEFDKYESEVDFVKDDIQGLGLSDKSFFRQAILKIKEYPKPFYTFLITLSSHYPYKDENDKIKNIIDVGEFEGTIVGDYIKSAKYTDEAVGEFIAQLKQEGLWDNSVVVFYGDHHAIPNGQKWALGKILYGNENISDLQWQEAQKVVSMIHFPNETIKGNVEKTVGQYDIYPTLANLYGLDTKYVLGRDILNTDDGFVVLRNGTWISDDAVYLNWVDKVFSKKTGEELDKSKYSREFERAYSILKASDAIVENNLIKYFRAED